MWREIRRALPEESLIYLGDGKNCPYGSLSEERVAELADAAVRQLLDEGCKLIVVACNTATAAAIERLRETFPSTPFVGLEPAVKPACLHTHSGVVGVVATERSLAGGKFLTTVERYCGGKRVVKAVGRGWVEAVEADEEHTPETERRVREVLDPITDRAGVHALSVPDGDDPSGDGRSRRDGDRPVAGGGAAYGRTA